MDGKCVTEKRGTSCSLLVRCIVPSELIARFIHPLVVASPLAFIAGKLYIQLFLFLVSYTYKDENREGHAKLPCYYMYGKVEAMFFFRLYRGVCLNCLRGMDVVER